MRTNEKAPDALAGNHGAIEILQPDLTPVEGDCQ